LLSAGLVLSSLPLDAAVTGTYRGGVRVQAASLSGRPAWSEAARAGPVPALPAPLLAAQPPVAPGVSAPPAVPAPVELPAFSALEQTGRELGPDAAASAPALALRFDGGPRGRDAEPIVAGLGDGGAALERPAPAEDFAAAEVPALAAARRSATFEKLVLGLKLSGLLFMHALAVHAGVGAQAADALIQAAAARYLRQFATIRIGVDKAPGNGHQAVSITVARRLRQLGFEGRLEVVYHPETKDKLEYLLPGFDPAGPAIQELPAAGVTAVSHDFLDSGDFGRVPLGLLGAGDRSPQWLNVDRLLTIEAFDWGPATLQFREERGKLDASWKVNLGLRDLPLALDIPNPEDADEFVSSRMSGAPELRAKVPGLVRIAESADRVETMAAYGLSYYDGWKKLLQLLRGALHAQRARPESFRGGVIVPIFSRIGEAQMKKLELAIQGDGALRGRVWRADIGDPDIVRRIDGVKKGDILLVRVGPAAQEVFEFFFSRSSLPPAVAGSNGINLMLAARKPFFKTTAGGAGILAALLPLHFLGVRRLVRKAHEELLFPASNDVAGRRVGEFMLAYMDEGSALRAAFSDKRPARLGRDKIVEALLRSARRTLLSPWSAFDFIRRICALVKSALRRPGRRVSEVTESVAPRIF
ncbi:MAG: hypothetical protein PHF00_12080, partial [Elusimicrobia bacterium]|nr:hypothetical protein [Elusimicrobiota bacterium]